MTPAPPQGEMYLFDSITPPLEDGSYSVTASTNVTYAGNNPSFSQQYYFDIVGPRFTVPQAMVAGTYPPANSHGTYQNFLPHIVLNRRTLPWERSIAPLAQMPQPAPDPAGVPPLQGPVPWVALLVFQDGEYTFKTNVPLEQAVPAPVFQSLGSPANVTCDAVMVPLTLVASIMPSVEELELLAHVRWVNVDDKELNTSGGDGYFSVVVANRLPQAGGQYRAFLVSLEGRTDLVTANPPPATTTGAPVAAASKIAAARVLTDAEAATSPASPAPTSPAAPTGTGTRNAAIDTSFTLTQAPVHFFPGTIQGLDTFMPYQAQASLVVLTSWQFTCEGPGPFRNLMQNLDDAMFGTVQNTGHPPLTDTGHLPVTLNDRLGASEQVWYRGPLVPWQLSRDTLGPYHAADQCRRVTPETGAEDISYGAAFEIGRLLGAADPRFAQALMRWRRESYRQSARASTINAFNALVPLGLTGKLAQDLHTPVAPLAAAAAVNSVVQSAPPIADAHGLVQVQNQQGLQAAQVAQAWNLSAAAATTLLNGTGGALGAAIPTHAQTARPDASLSTVAADTSGLDRLTAARTQAIQNATVILEES